MGIINNTLQCKIGEQYTYMLRTYLQLVYIHIHESYISNNMENMNSGSV